MKRRKEKIIMKKYCVKCGKQFYAIGREVICPSCKQAAAEDAKRAAVLKAKRASWAGESVPVRISGRGSTIIRRYGAANNMPFAQALDALLQASDYFKGIGVKWEEVEPYRSHRRDKRATENEQEVKQDKQNKQDKQDGTQATSKPQDAPQEVKAAGKPQEVTKAAKVANKNTTSKPQEVKAAKKGEKA